MTIPGERFIGRRIKILFQIFRIFRLFRAFMMQIDRLDIPAVSFLPEPFQIKGFPLQRIRNEADTVAGVRFHRIRLGIAVGIIGNIIRIETFDIKVDIVDATVSGCCKHRQMRIAFIAAIDQSHGFWTGLENIPVTASCCRASTHNQMICTHNIKAGMQSANVYGIHSDARHFIIGRRIADHPNGAVDGCCRFPVQKTVRKIIFRIDANLFEHGRSEIPAVDPDDLAGRIKNFDIEIFNVSYNAIDIHFYCILFDCDFV